MNLTELKNTAVSELVHLGESMGLENLARLHKKDIIFAILKAHAKSGEDIFGDGVLEILQDGFGFLRSADSSYLAGPDDIYVSPSQVRRFNLRTGDTISGKIRPPKEGERYFALLKVDTVNYDRPENARNKILFENLTPLHANSRLRMERGNGSKEDITARVLDLASPIGRGQRVRWVWRVRWARLGRVWLRWVPLRVVQTPRGRLAWQWRRVWWPQTRWATSARHHHRRCPPLRWRP
jgi:transcription termination factor Rho